MLIFLISCFNRLNTVLFSLYCPNFQLCCLFSINKSDITNPKISTWVQSQKERLISVRIQGKAFSITVIQVHAPTTNAEEAEVEWFCEDLQELLELNLPQNVLFNIGDWNAKVGSQETPGLTGKFGLGIWNET